MIRDLLAEEEEKSLQHPPREVIYESENPLILKERGAMTNMRVDRETRKEKTLNTIVEAFVVVTLAFLTLLIFATFI